jgi:NADP-dependent 3-hydroxy acid dehydrogenase YdfG
MAIVMNNPIAGKVVVLGNATEAASKAIARDLGGKGAAFMLGSPDVPGLYAFVDELVRQRIKVFALPTASSSCMEIAQLLAAADHAFGRVDVLINYLPSTTEHAAKGQNELQFSALPMLAVIQGMLAAFPRMQGRGDGHIINIVQPASSSGETHHLAQAVQKTMFDAVESLSEVIAANGIRTSLIKPGSQATAPQDTSSAAPGGCEQRDVEWVSSVARDVALLLERHVDAGMEGTLPAQMVGLAGLVP